MGDVVQEPSRLFNHIGPQTLHSLRGVELGQQGLGELDLAVDRIVKEDGGHRAASCAPVSNWISNPASLIL